MNKEQPIAMLAPTAGLSDELNDGFTTVYPNSKLEKKYGMFTDKYYIDGKEVSIYRYERAKRVMKLNKGRVN